MKYFSILWILAIPLFASSCFNYEVQEDGAYSDADNNNEVAGVGNEIVFTAGGNVFLMDEFGVEITQIYSGSDVVTASISPDHKKVLYKPSGQNVKIYDVENETNDGELSGTENVRWFDYHPNSETAFVIEGSNIKTFGPNVFTSSTVDLENLQGLSGNIVVNSAALLENGTIAFSYENTGTNSNYIALANQNVLILDNLFPLKYVHFRANVLGDEVWAGNENSTQLIKVNIPALNITAVEPFNDLGVPTMDGDGIEVSEDQIYLEGSNAVSPDRGTITSIDF